MLWQQWANLILGLWVIASAYIVNPENMFVNLLVTGGAVAILAAWGALEQRSMHERREHMHRHA